MKGSGRQCIPSRNVKFGLCHFVIRNTQISSKTNKTDWKKEKDTKVDTATSAGIFYFFFLSVGQC